ncbi:ATP synthase subunit I [Castellaniella denitrificans]|uniref:ATP synthase subunit I n=1 Tax=Castellaniella denitrificans TaxID=56119 RepID=A0ABT4M2L9_9BURK|nr:ATP synthase subunit I [Castellaniella denitrificans]MCZ4328361.1 ATP synthase subunit I [Castellaniella denitrificans]
MNARAVRGPDGSSSDTLVLDESERALIARRSRVGLLRALAAQAFTGMLVVLGAWGIAGKDAGFSALIGAVVYFVPNALFALRLLLGYFGPKRPGSLAFFWGEFLKLLTVAGVVVLVAWRWGDWLNWLAFLLGLLGVMKGYVVLLALRRLP